MLLMSERHSKEDLRISTPCKSRQVLNGYCKKFSSQSESNAEADYEDSIKEKLLESSLQFVNKRGWTTAAIADGAVSIGYPGVIHGIFSNPSVELIDYFNKKCNRELNEILTAASQSDERSTDPRQIIENAFQLRLKMIIPYIDKWPQALAIMSLPINIPVSFKTFSTLIDDVCYFSGDKSVDFNWYCRRAALSAIYKSTELCLVQDKTVDFIQTWTFLQRRLSEAFTIDRIMRSNANFANKARDFTTATFTTLGNILGRKIS